MRLDLFLHKHGLTRSRTEAADLISRGLVLVNGIVAQKVSANISDHTHPGEIKINKTHHYVGRGAEKLEHALTAWNIDVNQKVCLDVGSSTGGFSDCLLQRGAKEVYAVDVGTDQCDPFLKTDARFHLFEKTDIRKAKEMHAELTALITDIIVVDVSFISLAHILPSLIPFAKKDTQFILLIKPQFEIGNTDAKHLLNKNGIVLSEQGHKISIDVVRKACEEVGLAVTDVIQSPIKGGSGNSEFLLHAILLPNQLSNETDISMNSDSTEKNKKNEAVEKTQSEVGQDAITLGTEIIEGAEELVETKTDEIVEAIEANTKQLKSQNSLKARLLSGMIYGLGAGIGATVLLGIIVYILGFFSHLGILSPVNDWLVQKIESARGR